MNKGNSPIGRVKCVVDSCKYYDYIKKEGSPLRDPSSR